jgi:hypothetical protein
MTDKPLTKRQRELLDHLQKGHAIRGRSNPYTGGVFYTVYDHRNRPLDIFSRGPVNALLARGLITVSAYVVTLVREGEK